MSVNRLLANLAQSLDSSSVGSFLSGDSADRFQTLQWTDVSGRPIIADSATTTSIIDSAYVQSRVTTYAVGLDSATTISLLDSDYIRSKVTNDVGFFIYHYDTTSGQTLLDSSNEASNNAISYTKDYVMVFKNGVLLDSAAGDYTATSGNTVVLGSAADSGELVTVVKWAPGASSSGGGTGEWYGDRAIVAGDDVTIQYYDMTTTGNSTDFGDLTASRKQFSPVSDGVYGVFPGGYNTASGNAVIDYISIAVTSNASDFGDLYTPVRYVPAVSDGNYGVLVGGYGSSGKVNVMQYITIATPGNSTDFGDYGSTGSQTYGGMSDGTYGVIAPLSIGFASTAMEYITIATPGNSTTFGNDNANSRAYRYESGSCSDTTRGVIGGGFNLSGSVRLDDITYITIATPGNSTDFGNLTTVTYRCTATSNGTYATFNGGTNSVSDTNVIQYITIQTTGNASDFGDLVKAERELGATSGSPA